ncbi:MAG: FAD-dependent oxidoreductase [Rhodospirillaceae bacterium]|nr:FAD-dependent oxidoreductase [Rhodospirillaceae bacterium]
MAGELPGQAQVVIIGGGIVGCSVAYHLVKRGWSDVVLLERKSLTSGTTWHAAGLVGQLRATHNLTRLAQYTTGLYASLEAETEQATGFKQNGSLNVASDAERFEELTRGASMARCFGLEVEVVTPAEAGRMWPLLRTDDLVGAVFLPKDGQCNPTDTTQALARGARNGGTRIFENTTVRAIHHKAGKVTGVATDQGDIAAEFVVNCGGMWGREIAAAAGVNVPLHAAEHFYVVTEPMDGMHSKLPVLRDPGGCTYYKEDAGKLMVGAFEPVAKPWGMAGIPEDFEYGHLPDDWEHFEPMMELALNRVPALAEVGVQLFFNGPESFTPDDRYLLGEAPELGNFFVAAGFNSIGIQSAGGAGRVLADWMVDGYPPMDLWDVDLRRSLPFQSNRRYLHDRTVEALGLLYAMHWPYRQVETARPVRTSPLHERLQQHGACFGETAGWERPNWYAPEGSAARYEYSYGRQNWFEFSAAEHRAAREGVVLFDQTSFAKFRLEGRDAEVVLSRICANDVAVPPGRVVYTQWLNQRGGIEADLTVARLSESAFLIVTAAASQVRDFAWLKGSIPPEARAIATDVTSGLAVIGLMGPKSRQLLAALTPAALDDASFPRGSHREIEIGYGLAQAMRISYIGELGWEIYLPTEFAGSAYDAVVAAGRDHGLVHAGFHAMDSLRLEKGYKHWGHDITDEDTPLEAGLGFAVAFDKPAEFVGREALLRQRENGIGRRLVLFALDDPGPLLYHNEPIWRDGELVGRLTSGAYGHMVGSAIGMGYVELPGADADEFIDSGRFEIEVACQRLPARVLRKGG